MTILLPMNVANLGGAGTPPDTTPPTLSAASVTSFTATTANLSVTTNEGNGTLYCVIDTSATPPSAAQVKAGQGSGGGAATSSGNQAVTTTGVQTKSGAGGLTASTAYYTYFMHEDAAGNKSTVASASTFTTYSTEAQAVFVAMTTPPNAARKALIDAAIVGLKSDGVWTLLDSLQVYAAADTQAARVDWVLPSRVASLSNSPTFMADRGFTTDGASNYVDSLYDPSLGPNYTQNGGSFGVWSRTSTGIATSGSGWFNGTNGITINTRSNVNQTGVRPNQAAATTYTNADGSGFFLSNRSGAGATQAYRNGVSLGSSTGASTAVNSHSLLMGALTAVSFQAREWAASAAGGSLDATKQLALYNRLQTYMTAVGA